jgi:alkylation response protein AidB-like acyl-CoA dehydrogenase
VNVSDRRDRPGARFVEAARRLKPAILAAGDEIERARRLPTELVGRLVEAGLFHLLVPKTVGGSALPLSDFVQVVEEIASADGSVAWCLVQASGCSLTAAYLASDVAREMFGKPPGGILAWGPPVDAKAVAEPDGYRVTGRWSFASGCRHATRLGCACPVHETDGRRRLRPNGDPETLTLLIPAGQAEILDVWQVSGLRGTGSDTFVVADQLVPPERAFRRDDLASCREPGPLYAFRFENVFALGFASVALGIARGALDAFRDLANEKTPRGGRANLRESPVVQSQIALAEAKLRAARAFRDEVLGAAWGEATRTGALSLEQRVLIRLAATHAIHQAAEALDVAYHQAGSSAILESGPFERRFRDLHAVTQQLQGRQAHYQAAGQLFLGLEPDTSWL